MPTLKKIYRSERQIDRQNTILKTTRKLVSHVGYDGLRMRVLAEKSGVSPMTLYNLYSSKDELLLAALIDLLSELVRSAQVAAAKGFDRILLYQSIMSEEVERSPGYAEAMARALFQAKPEDRLVNTLLAEPIHQNLVQLVYEKNNGAIHEGVDPELLAHHITVQGWGVVLLWNKGLIDLDQVKRETTRSLLMTIIAVCKGPGSRRYKKRLAELDARWPRLLE